MLAPFVRPRAGIDSALPIAFTSLSDPLSHRYYTVIDVRSPAEFAEDHIPGAINIPLRELAQNLDRHRREGQ